MQEGRPAGRSDNRPLTDEDTGAFDADSEDHDPAIDNVVELSERERCARKFAIRRVIERRMEQKALDHDLDYLDYDLDD